MANFVKLTNNSPNFKGNPLYINIDHIVTVYEEQDEDGMFHTKLYGGFDKIVWDVEEPISKVINIFYETKKD